MDAKFMGSRKITMDDILKRLEHPVFTVAFEYEFDLEDHAMEDTLIVPIAMPRAAWKMLYGAAKSAGLDVGDMASEWLCDTAMDMIENMKPIRDEIMREEAERND